MVKPTFQSGVPFFVVMSVKRSAPSTMVRAVSETVAPAVLHTGQASVLPVCVSGSAGRVTYHEPVDGPRVTRALPA